MHQRRKSATLTFLDSDVAALWYMVDSAVQGSLLSSLEGEKMLVADDGHMEILGVNGSEDYPDKGNGGKYIY